jgi:hypothetical protein
VRRSARNLRVAAVLGLLLGIAASAADSFQGFGSDFRPWVRVLSIALNLIVVWVGAAFVAGRMASSRAGAALAGALALYAAVFGYYVFGGLFGDRVHVGLWALSGATLQWLAVATVAGPIFGLLGWLSRRKGVVGGMAVLSLPAAALLEVLVILRISVEGFTIDPLREWTIAAALVLALLFAVATMRVSNAPTSAAQRSTQLGD